MDGAGDAAGLPEVTLAGAEGTDGGDSDSGGGAPTAADDDDDDDDEGGVVRAGDWATAGLEGPTEGDAAGDAAVDWEREAVLLSPGPGVAAMGGRGGRPAEGTVLAGADENKEGACDRNKRQ